jgi:hypothetical protein
MVKVNVDSYQVSDGHFLWGSFDQEQRLQSVLITPSREMPSNGGGDYKALGDGLSILGLLARIGYDAEGGDLARHIGFRLSFDQAGELKKWKPVSM